MNAIEIRNLSKSFRGLYALDGLNMTVPVGAIYGSIEGYYATSALSGMKLTVDAYMEAVRNVTKADVARMAKLLKRHTTYFLKGAAQ